jgi:hypothetical protein
MKNLAKLILYFSVLFVLVFLAAILLRLLGSWIDMARTIPLGAEPGVAAIELAWKALPVVVYLSVLFALSYAARRKIPVFSSILCVLLLCCGFTAGFSLGISRTGVLQFALKPVSALESMPGLILSHADNSIILLKESSETRGPRVVSIPERPLIYQEVPLGPNNSILSLPAIPFYDNTPWFIRSLELDFNLSAREIEGRFKEDFFSFAVYVFSLILFLSSFRFLMDLSQWPLANLFLGALVFRFILSLETFLNSPEINSLLDSFLTGRLAPAQITPLAFSSLGVLVIVYNLVVRIARPGRIDGDED